MAVVQDGSCSSEQTPSLGTSIYHRCSPKKNKKKKKQNKAKNKQTKKTDRVGFVFLVTHSDSVPGSPAETRASSCQSPGMLFLTQPCIAPHSWRVQAGGADSIFQSSLLLCDVPLGSPNLLSVAWS